MIDIKIMSQLKSPGSTSRLNFLNAKYNVVFYLFLSGGEAKWILPFKIFPHHVLSRNEVKETAKAVRDDKRSRTIYDEINVK